MKCARGMNSFAAGLSLMPDAGFVCCGAREWVVLLREDGSEPELGNSVKEDPGVNPAEDRLPVVVVERSLLMFIGTE